MESSNQILDAFTSHLSLYHSASATASPSPNSNPRASILRWFSNLSIHQRQSHLTIIDSHFLKILLQMRARTLRNGHGFFFLLPDLPSTSDPSLPTICFRRSTGLLARSYAANHLEMEIFQSLRLFGSKDGVETGECEIDAFTVCEEFVGDLDRFVEVMDAVSNGEFLSGEVDGVIGVEWAELPWLKAKGYYTLESFVANRIELALRLAWMVNCSGGKKQKVMRLLKEKNAGMGFSANVFWRRRGCMDWFLGLDPGVKKKVCLTFLRKGAKSLAREITESSDDSLKCDMLQFKAKSSPNYYTFAASHRRNEFPCRKDLEFSLLGIPKLISGSNSSLSTHLKDLIVLQQIVEFLFACQQSGLEAENIFFSTLGSTQTISDFIMRRLRGFLMVISSDCIEFELMTDTIKSNHMKKDEEKSAESSERSKRKPHKIGSSNKKFSRNNSALQEPREDYRCCRLPTETNVTPSHPVLTNNLDHGSFSQTVGTIVVNEKDLTPELADNKSHISRKRRGRKKGKNRSSAVKETKNKGENPQVDMHEILSLPQDGETKTVGRGTSTRSTSIDAAVLFSLQHQSSSFEVDNEADMLDVGVKKAVVVDCPSQSDGTKENEHLKNEIYQIRDNIANMNISNNECLYSGNDGDMKKERSTIPFLSKDTYLKPTTSDSAFSYNPKDTDSVAHLMPSCGLCFDADGINHVSSSRSTSDKDLQASAPSNIFQSTDVMHCVSKNDNSTGDPRYLKTSAKGTSYEWPSLIPVNSAHFNPDHCPAATDRLHLDIGHNQLNYFHQSFLSSMHPIINAPIECGNGLMVPPKISPLNLDCSLVARNGSRFCQTAPNYDPVPRLQSTLCSGIANNGMHFQGAYSDSEWRNSSDVIDLSSYQNSSDMMDDTESRWMSDDESDVYAHTGRDYSKYFGGGVMYWNTSDHLGTSFSRDSRPPSHSSEDSSWAWYEADLNRAIDDMVGLPAYSVNSLTSPTAGSFCSPFESIGSGQQSLAYVISSNDVGVLNSQLPTKDNLEESTSGSLNISSGNAEGMNGDLFPYPILRPIITPSLSRKSSRSDFKHNHDHKSPCLPSTRRDHPRIKRPLSPVVLCVPRAPRVPPPSPVGESRKHKGFPVVRSGSSSPRHWGVKSWYHEDISSEDVNCCLDGPEVVWAAWANKSISGNKLMQGIPGSLLQDRLIAISQLGRDQEHPDVAFPVQPPGLVNSSSKTSVTVMQALLHEEINAFCKQVTSESQSRKPFINWAVKRVARSLQVLWPRSRTSIFGSNSTGLALPTSDVDLVVCLPPVRNLEPIKEAGILEGRNGIKETCLQHAARYLANQEWVKNDSLKTIENTAIPLIMLVAEVPLDITATSENISLSQLEETSSMASVQTCNPLQPGCANLENSSDSSVDADIYVKPICIDISFKSSTHTGLQTTQLVRELTEQFPASIPLALVLKQFLADRSLDHAYSGGLSSYCLVLLITRFLQHEHHLGRSLNQNLGILLMDFLYFFGNIFDPRQMRVSIQGSGLYMSRERGQSIDPIHIDDPLCPTNNVGRNCFRIHQCIKMLTLCLKVR